jgi:predicted NACHT family NTPase
VNIDSKQAAEWTAKATGRFDSALLHIHDKHLLQTIHEGVRVAFEGSPLVTEAITQHQQLVLLGEPGSGKSTALRYLALTLAQAGLDESVDLAAQLEGWDTLGEQGRLLPLFLPLLPFAKRFINPADHPCNSSFVSDWRVCVFFQKVFPSASPSFR